MSTVRLVNCFEVPAGRDDDFMAHWSKVNAYMVSRPGYVAHRLHRSLRPDARYRFVNYVAWESAELLGKARDEGFDRLRSGPGWSAFTSTQALYEVVHEGTAAPQSA